MSSDRGGSRSQVQLAGGVAKASDAERQMLARHLGITVEKLGALPSLEEMQPYSPPPPQPSPTAGEAFIQAMRALVDEHAPALRAEGADGEALHSLYDVITECVVTKFAVGDDGQALPEPRRIPPDVLQRCFEEGMESRGYMPAAFTNVAVVARSMLHVAWEAIVSLRLSVPRNPSARCPRCQKLGPPNTSRSPVLQLVETELGPQEGVMGHLCHQCSASSAADSIGVALGGFVIQVQHPAILAAIQYPNGEGWFDVSALVPKTVLLRTVIRDGVPKTRRAEVQRYGNLIGVLKKSMLWQPKVDLGGAYHEHMTWLTEVVDAYLRDLGATKTTASRFLRQLDDAQKRVANAARPRSSRRS